MYVMFVRLTHIMTITYLFAYLFTHLLTYFNPKEYKK